MNEEEKQSLGCARVLLQRPQWLVVDGSFDKLDPALRSRIEALFTIGLGAGLVNIGPDSSQAGFFTRKLRLLTDPHGASFMPADHYVSPAA